MKRVLCFALCFTLLSFLLLPLTHFKADAAAQRYPAANDELLTHLPEPSYRDYVMYVPSELFTGYLGISINYDSSLQVLTVTNGKKTLYFNHKVGLTFDQSDELYSYMYYYSSGSFMLPALFVSNFFGLNYSYLSSGPVVRITNGYNSLTNQEFLEKYDYVFNPPDEASPEISIPTIPIEEYEKSIFLTFEVKEADELPDILNSLISLNYKATFFVTSEIISGSPELIFRMIAQGHEVGILVPEDFDGDPLEYAKRTNELLYLHVKRLSQLVRLENNATAGNHAEELIQSGFYVSGFNIDAKSSESANALYSFLTASVKNRKTPAVIAMRSDIITSESLDRLLVYFKQDQHFLQKIKIS